MSALKCFFVCFIDFTELNHTGIARVTRFAKCSDNLDWIDGPRPIRSLIFIAPKKIIIKILINIVFAKLIKLDLQFSNIYIYIIKILKL